MVPGEGYDDPTISFRENKNFCEVQGLVVYQEVGHTGKSLGSPPADADIVGVPSRFLTA